MWVRPRGEGRGKAMGEGRCSTPILYRARPQLATRSLMKGTSNKAATTTNDTVSNPDARTNGDMMALTANDAND